MPQAVLAAYGVTGEPRAINGGQGVSVRVGDLVLKPGADAEETAWLAGLGDRITHDGFRLPLPVRSGHGHVVVDGWSATRWVPGAAVDDDDTSAEVWLVVLEAGRAFHRAVAAEPEPPFLATRRHRWALADRVAWGAPRGSVEPALLGVLDRLARLVGPEGLPDQLVHGDLSGNVLLHPDLSPAIIDVSPAWRPPAYADAVVVADALLWWRADPVLVGLGRPTGLPETSWRSLLARALTFRLLAESRPLEALPAYDGITRLLEG